MLLIVKTYDQLVFYYNICPYTICFVIIHGLLDPSVQNGVMHQAWYSWGNNDQHPFLLETLEPRTEFTPSG